MMLQVEILVLMLGTQTLYPLSYSPGPWPRLLIPPLQYNFRCRQSNGSRSFCFSLPHRLDGPACHVSPQVPGNWQVLKASCWKIHLGSFKLVLFSGVHDWQVSGLFSPASQCYRHPLDDPHGWRGYAHGAISTKYIAVFHSRDWLYLGRNQVRKTFTQSFFYPTNT